MVSCLLNLVHNSKGCSLYISTETLCILFLKLYLILIIFTSVERFPHQLTSSRLHILVWRWNHLPPLTTCTTFILVEALPKKWDVNTCMISIYFLHCMESQKRRGRKHHNLLSYTLTCVFSDLVHSFFIVMPNVSLYWIMISKWKEKIFVSRFTR